MSRFFTILAVGAIALAFGCAEGAKTNTANNATPPVAASPVAPQAESKEQEHDNAPRITLADAKKDYDAGKAVIVDVRDANTYVQEHIKGSINIPLAEVNGSLDKLPKGKKIIAYCS